MAANQAAPPVPKKPRESTGRFDEIRFDRVFAEVHIPGYDLNKAIARREKRAKKRRPPAPAAPPPAPEPVVFGSGTPVAPEAPFSQPPSGADEPELKLEL